MKGIIYSFHTGQWGGIITRILYFLSAFVGGILPLTGYYLWIKRISRKNIVKFDRKFVQKIKKLAEVLGKTSASFFISLGKS